MYDMFLRKEVYKDKPWYNQMSIFFAIGICEVPDQDVKEVREALARFLYGTRVAVGENPGCSYIIGTTAIDCDEMEAYIQSILDE
jgi:hypothetical protein